MNSVITASSFSLLDERMLAISSMVPTTSYTGFLAYVKGLMSMPEVNPTPLSFDDPVIRWFMNFVHEGSFMGQLVDDTKTTVVYLNFQEVGLDFEILFAQTSVPMPGSNLDYINNFTYVAHFIDREGGQPGPAELIKMINNVKASGSLDHVKLGELFVLAQRLYIQLNESAIQAFKDTVQHTDSPTPSARPTLKIVD